MWRQRVTPLGALVRGLVSGAVGAGVMTLFFQATRRIAPAPPADAFIPPEAEQTKETATQTVARRLVEHLAQRGPISDEQKHRLGELVHYGFGALWGGLYGLGRESVPATGSLAGALGFGTAVWTAGDHVILPAFRLGGWPNRYPLAAHGYAWAAHLLYGAAVVACYEALRLRPWSAAATALWALRLQRRLVHLLPRRLRPGIVPMIETIGTVRDVASRAAWWLRPAQA